MVYTVTTGWARPFAGSGKEGDIEIMEIQVAAVGGSPRPEPGLDLAPAAELSALERHCEELEKRNASLEAALPKLQEALDKLRDYIEYLEEALRREESRQREAIRDRLRALECEVEMWRSQCHKIAGLAAAATPVPRTEIHCVAPDDILDRLSRASERRLAVDYLRRGARLLRLGEAAAGRPESARIVMTYQQAADVVDALAAEIDRGLHVFPHAEDSPPAERD